MNEQLIKQYGFVKQIINHRKMSIACWCCTLKRGKKEIQVVIDCALAYNSKLVAKEIAEAKKRLEEME